MNGAQSRDVLRWRLIRRRIRSVPVPTFGEALKVGVITIALTVVAMWLHDLIRFLFLE